MRGTWRLRLALRYLRGIYLKLKAEFAVARFRTDTQTRPHGLDGPLIVSLTSFPPRYPALGKTLRSLLSQTVRPDRVVLWLAEADLSSLPAEVSDLCDHGLTIRGCRDIRSYKKLIPALHEWPEAYIVTADDDVYYPPDWLDSLVAVAKDHPREVIASRVHLAGIEGTGGLSKYNTWQLASSLDVAPDERSRLFPTGVGGVLYPPKSLHEKVMDESAFMRLCPNADDVWFFWMARMQGSSHRRARDWFDIVEWPTSQHVALKHSNYELDGNDAQISAMQEAFGTLP